MILIGRKLDLVDLKKTKEEMMKKDLQETHMRLSGHEGVPERHRQGQARACPAGK